MCDLEAIGAPSYTNSTGVATIVTVLLCIPPQAYLHPRDHLASVSHFDRPNQRHVDRKYQFHETSCELPVTHRNNLPDLPHVRSHSRQCHAVPAVIISHPIPIPIGEPIRVPPSGPRVDVVSPRMSS